MSKADKRIPVTEDTWQELSEMKQAGETYDELIQELIEKRREENRRRLLEETDDDEYVALEDL
ncbi:MAG: antitoxin VapB family protein [Halobacteria archaeon]|nr:antitoxin VapB family protein [Halobacteria archaeon]